MTNPVPSFGSPKVSCGQPVLSLTDGMLSGHVSDEALTLVEESFEPSERIELIVTAGFYCMVPRVLDALRLSADADDSNP